MTALFWNEENGFGSQLDASGPMIVRAQPLGQRNLLRKLCRSDGIKVA